MTKKIIFCCSIILGAFLLGYLTGNMRATKMQAQADLFGLVNDYTILSEGNNSQLQHNLGLRIYGAYHFLDERASNPLYYVLHRGGWLPARRLSVTLEQAAIISKTIEKELVPVPSKEQWDALIKQADSAQSKAPSLYDPVQ